MRSVTVVKYSKLIRTVISIWRFYYMTNKASKVIRNVGIGLAAGSAVAVIGSSIAGNKKSKPMRNMKKAAGRALNNVSSALSSVENMLS